MREVNQPAGAQLSLVMFGLKMRKIAFLAGGSKAFFDYVLQWYFSKANKKPLKLYA
jgi:hypothetical protein